MTTPAGIEVVPWREEWPAAFEALAASLRPALAHLPGVEIEHVGSTSVPGLAAKPILDVDVVVSRDQVPAAVAALEGLGYRHRGDLGVTDREAFHPPAAPAGEMARHVYVCVRGTLHVRNHLALREVLRARPDLRDAYGAVKLALASEPGLRIEEYLARKSAVVQQALALSGLTVAEREEIWRLNDPDRARTRAVQEEWDAQAEAFDDEPDHGLRHPAVRAAWRDLLAGLLPVPAAGSRIADLGCGTGTLTDLLLGLGHGARGADGLDVSPRMLDLARAKVPQARFLLGDAATPPLAPAAYEVVVARHVLWALPDPAAAVRRWVRLLAPGGRLVLVEGRWHTGAGLTATEVATLVARTGFEPVQQDLTDPALWGGPITDHRHLTLVHLP
ncbi:GrpB family protein [Nocardioides sp.]|uniref:GrpB family protein n=1 Tax=Nocardioides sp. TaxID=35761 RepID=UPI003518CC8C